MNDNERHYVKRAAQVTFRCVGMVRLRGNDVGLSFIACVAIILPASATLLVLWGVLVLRRNNDSVGAQEPDPLRQTVQKRICGSL